ncbi:hypothetical protein TWF730_010528 [Orbilia blumenaviensis]|uniref:Uncharacterized protein n=1 Tax=Orbilia blumenaviensis TaxID=1796055 RepID=A0AAV9UNI1_9PEZI
MPVMKDLVNILQGSSSSAPDRINLQSNIPPDPSAVQIIPSRSEMTGQSPSLYKLIILKNELQREDWRDATVSIFDTNDNPTPENHPVLLFQLANYTTSALKFLERIIDQINANKQLEGTGCKYCLFAAVRYDTDPHGHHRGVILKLTNINREFREYSRGGDEPPRYAGATSQ